MGTFSYHFNLGNSTDGPLGVVVQIAANSRKQALERLKERCDQDGIFTVYTKNDAQVDYFNVYFNFNQITEKDIDFVLDEDGNEIDYETTCPHCGAEDQLFIVEANGVKMHSRLEPDGFEVPDEVAAKNGDPKDYSTTDEQVQCQHCGYAVDFSKLML